MTQVMAYAILWSAAIAGVAAVLDLVARWRRVPRRWIWTTAIAGIVPLVMVVMTVPRATPVPAASPVAAESAPPVSVDPVLDPDDSAGALLARLDTSLAIGWLVLSAALLVTLVGGQWRLRHAARRAHRGEILGHGVLLTDDLGPAVAGFARPVVFIPRWVVALDAASQRLLLAHEVEHVRRRDTMLLMAGAIVTALVPWNPVAWWLASRLRVAVELDCDRRVLAEHPDVRPYVDLLLLAADRPRLASRLQAAHFGERASDLSTRIDAMTDRGVRSRPIVATVVVAGVLIALACEAPRPEPIAPGLSKATGPELAPSVLFEYQVEKPVTMAVGSISPKYPDILRTAGVEGEVLVSFVVDETGHADLATFKVLRSTHDLFAAAVKRALADMEFMPAEAGGKAVKQLVEQPFTFSLPGAKRWDASSDKSESGPEVEVGSPNSAPHFHFSSGVGETQPTVNRAKLPRPDDQSMLMIPDGRPTGSPTAVLRGKKTIRDIATVSVLDNEGRELAREYAQDSTAGVTLLGRIPPTDIAAIEVYKGDSCDRTPACPYMTVRLKPGRTLPRRQRE